MLDFNQIFVQKDEPRVSDVHCCLAYGGFTLHNLCNEQGLSVFTPRPGYQSSTITAICSPLRPAFQMEEQQGISIQLLEIPAVLCELLSSKQSGSCQAREKSGREESLDVRS